MSFSDLTFLFYFLPLFFAVYYILPFRFKNAALVLGSFAFYFIGAARATHCCCPACCFCTTPSPRNGGERRPHAKSTADHRAGGGPLLPCVLQVRRIYSGKSGQTDGDGVLPCRACAAARRQLLPFPERGVPHRRLSRRGGGGKPHRLRRFHHRVPPAHDGADLTLPRMARRTEGTHDHARGRILRL